MISAILLAAGQSTRMGSENKLLMRIGGRTLIERMVDVVTASDIAETILVLGHQAGRVRPLVEAKPVRIVENLDYAEGMGSSFQAGLQAVSPEASAVMICLTDQPLLETEDVNHLIHAFQAQQEKSMAVPRFKGQRGNPVLFSTRYRAEVMATRGPVAGCRGIIQKYPEAVLAVEMNNDHILWDMDTPADYEAIQKKLLG
ncbi:MAG: nucleotidyltransferase family protein [Deltaproteobacteria bacterium]|nr:nucleotidyltransferase family protein [Deltaproteobacteria bacterium]